ncbi:DUF6461 domain-containing protein [Streptosporangium roseum]|uniref:Uncharacterized protein n=1 Tax=Streptosporangium roseum (strain ATCC 12428 / DSM 43021 / JCM 3005 / KCTC 9067 / NCIMB 10171 / NRRL 2505 / NI 9100) TaxID=479432 RepID=D2AS52_STRRD|nr:DUF6461 domain-containing protein [Streptosporangium roseum]ACZ86579.1 hypothetical protein Sros_3650 [Streptosporangium roseum DSM 43021]
MTMQPLDISWLCGEYSEECYSFIYIRATPEQVIARLGGRWEDFTPGPFPDDPDHYPRSGEPLGVTSIGDWTFVFDPDWLGTCEDVITELSQGTRLVSQAALAIKGMDYFYWCENGEIRFCFGVDAEHPTETPDELVDTMTEIDRLYPSFPPLYEGPAFLLVEHLTGIRVTEHLLKGSTFMWGVVPEPAKS